MAWTSIPQSTIDQIAPLYASGLTSREVVAKLGISYSAFRYWKAKLGFPSHPVGRPRKAGARLTRSAKIKLLREALEGLLDERCPNCGFDGGRVERTAAREAMESTR